MTRVLIVDDNQINLLTLKNQLKLLGLEADTAYTGTNALDMHISSPYTIILLDHYMAGMSGAELGRKIREHDTRTGHVTQLYSISADSDTETINAFAELGIIKHLKKPITQQMLTEALAEWITRPLGTPTTVHPSIAPSEHINWNDLKKWLPHEPRELQAFLLEFSRTTLDGIQLMENALADGNYLLVANEAHRLKAPPKAFGMQTLAMLLEQIQQSANRLADKSVLLSLIAAVKLQQQQIEAELSRKLSIVWRSLHQ